MKPFDPRLLRYAKSVRGVLAVGALLGLIRTAAIIGWCWFASQALMVLIAPALGGEHWGVVLDRAQPQDALPWLLLGAFASVVIRSAASWTMDLIAARGAIVAKQEIRQTALDALDRTRVDTIARQSETETATTLGRGLDALDGYFSAYLPQLILTFVATPFLVLAVLLADWLSAAVVLVVLPVIPMFMILIGMATSAVQKRQWNQLQHLSRSFLDVVSGLTTLKIYRREHRQEQRIGQQAQEYRKRTMKLLGVTFMSGFVLDLAGTFSVALVAVTVGTRLIAGTFPLALGLFVLLLLPEVFVPIRLVGVAFHQSTEGLEASQAAFELIESAEAAEQRDAAANRNAARSDEPQAPAIFADNVCVEREHTVIGPHSFTVAPGEILALSGASGGGKSTLVAALMGFVGTASGTVATGSVAWAGQRPGLLQGTVGESIALGCDTVDLALARQVLDELGLAELPLDRQLGALGAGLSGGQAQRVAIARCIYRARTLNTDAIIMDEPTSALDGENERLVCELARREADSGRAVLIVSHRPAVLAAADRNYVVAAETQNRQGVSQ